MFCPSCGTKNNYYHRYCFYCGTALVEIDQEDEGSLESSATSSKVLAPVTLKPSKQSKMTDPLDYLKDSEPISSNHSMNISDRMEDEDFDMSNQIPLRRFQKEERSGNGLKTLVTVCLSLVLTALILFIAYVGYDQLLKDQKPAFTPTPVVEGIDYLPVVEAVFEDDLSARRITIYTQYGEQVKILGKTLPVINGKAEIIIKDTELYALQPTTAQENMTVTLPVFILADDYPQQEETLIFNIPVPFAPITFIQPTREEAIVDSASYNLILTVLPGSTVWVNDNNYAHLIDKEGHLTVNLSIPDQPQSRYIITVSTKGYADITKEILLKRIQMDFPLTVKQLVPIKATGEWVNITGTTDPLAILSSNLEFESEPEIHPDTGAFTLAVKVTSPGLTPFSLTAKLEGKEDSVLSLVIDKAISESDYTSTAWALEYEQMKSYPNLHTGKSFAFTGSIKDIISSGDKSVFIVDVSSIEGEEKLILIEHWGTFAYSKGQRLRIFGNRWGNTNGIPRILARHIYRG